jgi:hypothetical protein
MIPSSSEGETLARWAPSDEIEVHGSERLHRFDVGEYVSDFAHE